jgi:membrane protease YdiL (CAAX protease family)
MQPRYARTFLTARKSADFSSGKERSAAVRALTLAAVLVGWSLLLPRFPPRWHPVPHAAVGMALAVITRAPLGLRPPALWRGLRLGLAVAAPVALGVASSTALPPVRVAMAEYELPQAAVRWLLLRIPLGTVWAEEASYRAALGTVANSAFGPIGGRLLQSAAFGLSHIADARATGEPVVGTVVVTGLVGWLFGWLHERSGSLAAPMLAHLAINEAGAVGALAVQYSAWARSRGELAP